MFVNTPIRYANRICIFDMLNEYAYALHIVYAYPLVHVTHSHSILMQHLYISDTHIRYAYQTGILDMHIRSAYAISISSMHIGHAY